MVLIKWFQYLMLKSCIRTIPVVIMTIDKTDIVDEETTDLKSLLRSTDDFYIDGECVSRRIFYDDIGKSWIQTFSIKGLRVSKIYKIDAYLIWPRVFPFRLIGEFQSGFLHIFKDDSDVGDIVMLVAL